ncbi:MAG: XRE family transcriptional regulator [Alphaproteobacteria bacterium]|nr:XRE family transcriptional regulator [Alphaproteobacteria bacterium]
MQQDTAGGMIVSRPTELEQAMSTKVVKTRVNESLQETLCRLICVRVRQLGLSQADVRDLFDLDRPAASRLLNERHHGFSVERLMRFVVLLRHEIDVIVRPLSPRSKRKPGIQLNYR